MGAAALLQGALGPALLAIGAGGAAAVLWAAPRRSSPAALTLVAGLAALAVAGALAVTATPVPGLPAGDLAALAALVVAAGSILAFVEMRTAGRQLRSVTATAESQRREIDRLAGVNVRLEDEVQEARRTARAPAGKAAPADDIAQRQREAFDTAVAAARRLRAVVDGATEGIALLEPKTLRLAEANPALATLAGIDAKTLSQRTIVDLLGTGAERPGRADLQRAARERRPLATEIQRADGTAVPVEITIAVVGSGDEERLLAVVRDVTAQRTATADAEASAAAAASRARAAEAAAAESDTRAAQLSAENVRLTALHERKDEYLSTVSHELRTPLTSIRSFSEILLKHGDSEPGIRQEFLEIIQKESERLTRMVNNVLDLARIEAGETRLALSDFDARGVVTDAVRAMQGMSQAAGVRIAAQTGDAPRPLRADRDRTQQILMNLLSNAIKFSPAGGEVAIRIEDAPQGGRVRFAVEDHGPGIAAGDQARVFDKFQRVEGATGGARTGTGLGLAICREVVTLHGGRIWLESTAGSGSTFRAEFPGPEESASRSPAAAAPAPPPRLGMRPPTPDGGPRLPRARQISGADGALPPIGR